MIQLTIFLLLSLAQLSAQTTIRPAQILAGDSPASPIRIMVFDSLGRVTVMELEGYVVDLLSTPPKLVPALSTGGIDVDDIIEPTSPTTGVVLTRVPRDSPKVYVNGLLYTSPKDYALSGTQLTLKIAVGLKDIVRILYKR